MRRPLRFRSQALTSRGSTRPPAFDLNSDMRCNASRARSPWPSSSWRSSPFLVLRGRDRRRALRHRPVDRGDVAGRGGGHGDAAGGDHGAGRARRSRARSTASTPTSTPWSARARCIARLDPSLLQARLGQAQANLVAAQANVERARADGRGHAAEARARAELSAEQLLPASGPGDGARQPRRGGGRSSRRSQAAVTPGRGQRAPGPGGHARTPSSPPPSTASWSRATSTSGRRWPPPSRPRCCS